MSRSDLVSSRVLFNDRAYLAPRNVARLYGFRKAIIIQQIHYWVMISQESDLKAGRSDHYRDGHWWMWNSYAQWKKELCGIVSERTLRRDLTDLRKEGVIVAASHSASDDDQTLWYRIDNDALEAKVADLLRADIQRDSTVDSLTTGGGQDGQGGVDKMTTGGGQDGHLYTESTTKTSPKTSPKEEEVSEGVSEDRECERSAPPITTSSLTSPTGRSDFETKKKELADIEREKSLDSYLLRLSQLHEVPFSVPVATSVALQLNAALGSDLVRPYIQEKFVDFLAAEFDAKRIARFLVQDTAEWKQKRAERVNARKNETNAPGGDLEAHGRPELPHDVAFYDDGVIRADLERILSKSNEYYRTDDFLKVLFRRFVGQEEQIMDWLKARGLR